MPRPPAAVAVALAVALSAVFSLIALVHVYWALRGTGAGTGSAVPSRSDGTPLFRPGRIATLGVAVALFVAATLVLARVQLVSVGLSSSLGIAGTWCVSVLFALRTVGEFRYVGLFKRVRSTPFAKWDTRLFTPLCAVIAIAAALVAI